MQGHLEFQEAVSSPRPVGGGQLWGQCGHAEGIFKRLTLRTVFSPVEVVLTNSLFLKVLVMKYQIVG